MYKLVIVDDEPKIRRGISRWIYEFDLGYELIGEAGSYSDLLVLLEGSQVDVFLMDINMPEVNGLDMIQKLNRRYPKAKTIIISGYDDFEYTRKALKLKVYDYLLKPIPKTDLYKILLDLKQELDSEDLGEDLVEDNISGISKRVKKYIEENYSNSEVTLDNTAKLFNINKNYLTKLMKEELGSTFIDYLTYIRLAKAKEILLDPSFYSNIGDIAKKVGFNSQHYFSRVFKNKEGISPLEYRNKYSKNH